MTGFSRAEVRIIALAARHHRKVEPQRGRGLMRLLSKGDCRRVRYLAAILRIADALDRTHARLVRAVRCSVSPQHRRACASTPTAIPSWRSGRRGARATCSRSWPSRKLRFAVDQVREREERPRRAEPEKPEPRGRAPRAPARQRLRAPGGLARGQVVDVTFALTRGVTAAIMSGPGRGTICQCAI